MLSDGRTYPDLSSTEGDMGGGGDTREARRGAVRLVVDGNGVAVCFRRFKHQSG